MRVQIHQPQLFAQEHHDGYPVLHRGLGCGAQPLGPVPPVGAGPTPPPRLFGSPKPGPAGLGDQIQGDSLARQPSVLPQGPVGPASAPWLAVREAERRVAGQGLSKLGPRRQNRTVRGALPHPEGAGGRTGGPDPLRRQAAGAGGARGRLVGPADRTAADLQRLLDRRRRDRPAGLRQLRHPVRLRRTRPPRDFRQGRDRDRQVRRFLARHQAEGGRRARRYRLPDLLRSRR